MIKLDIQYIIKKSHKEGKVTVIDEMEIISTSLVEVND